jgi:dihydroorotate dehydrogenase
MNAAYPLVRALLFRLDAETAHDLVLRLVRWAGLFPPAYALLRALYTLEDARLEVEAFGVRFRNPVGLAAGYDKNGLAVRGLSALGFGHIEVGTLTLHAQAGNPRPRIHRIPQAQALINRMGFPNAGVDALRICGDSATRIGINIGKSKDTPLPEAAEDYCALLRRVYHQADYVALNVSSPNTPELRQLQTRGAIESLLKAVAAVRDSLQPRVPLLVKIAPDLTWAEVDDILAAVAAAGIDGVIATNTTLERGGVPERFRHLAGGLSGAPLRARATELVRYIARRTEGQLPIIGVGGIGSAADALEKLDAGACLVQVYTGLVYAGPGLVRAINQALLARA